MVPLKPLWWWNQAEDGQPGHPIECRMTETGAAGVLPVRGTDRWLEWHWTAQGILTCAIKKRVLP